MDADAFFVICKSVGMSSEDLQIMDFGQALDIIAEYVSQHKEEGNGAPVSRKATQSDFDNF